MASLVPPGESRVSPHLEVPFAMEGDIVTDSGCGQLGVGGHTIPPLPEYRRVDSVSPIGHSSVSPGPVPFNRLESVRKAVQRLRRAWRGEAVLGGGRPLPGSRKAPLQPPDVGTDAGTGLDQTRLTAARRTHIPLRTSGLHSGLCWSQTGREAVDKQNVEKKLQEKCS